MHEEFDKLVQSAKLSKQAGEKLSQFEPGSYCCHSSWGYGKVASWDLLGDKILLDFVDKPGHALKLEFAAKSLELLEEGHYMIDFIEDPEAAKAVAKEDAVELVRQILSANGSSMSLDQFDDCVSGILVPKEKYKSWWESVKRKLKQDKRFTVPSNRRDPLQLRDESVSAVDSVKEDFAESRDLKSKAKALKAALASIDEFKSDEAALNALITEANEVIGQNLRLQSAPCVELILARNAIQEEVPSAQVADQPGLSELLLARRADLDEFLPKLPVAAQRAAYAAYPQTFGEDWADVAIGMLGVSGLRATSELCKLLNAENKTPALKTYVEQGIRNRGLPSDLLAWVCKERGGESKMIFSGDGELVGAIFNALERDFLEEGVNKGNRLRDCLSNDGDLLSDLVTDCNAAASKSVGRRLMACPVFDELSRRSLLARMIKTNPEVEAILTEDDNRKSARSEKTDDSSEKLVVSWESLEKRKQDLEELISKRLPANRKEIQIAREYGDLSENFEYKAAKQEQAKLNAERTMMEQDLKRARGTDFKDADTTQASVGTTVSYKDEQGAVETYSILGAWDTNLDQHIISYLSETAKALVGHKIGESVELPTEVAGENRLVEITEVKGWAS